MQFMNTEIKHKFLGAHTTLSIVKEKRNLWRRIPYLKENDGHAPPLILAVGDRRRVYSIARRLRHPVLLPEETAKLANPRLNSKELPSTSEFGRSAIAIGTIASIPVTVVETQIGSPATQIILNEILSDDLTINEYKVGRKKINLDRKTVIRIGTSGGINCEGKPLLKVGDIVNATHSLGATGAIMQSLLQLDFWHPDAYEAFRSRWISLGEDFTFTKTNDPRVECSTEVIEAIEKASLKLSPNNYCTGGNVTKDSLYAELNADVFLDMCRAENCRTTEMELSTIAVAAREHNANFGMVSAIVGTLPGSSFAKDEKAKRLAEKRAVLAGLESLKGLT